MSAEAAQRYEAGSTDEAVGLDEGREVVGGSDRVRTTGGRRVCVEYQSESYFARALQVPSRRVPVEPNAMKLTVSVSMHTSSKMLFYHLQQ